MNKVMYGHVRQNLILESLSFFRYLSISQIVTLRFVSVSGYTQARRVMKRMYDEGTVKRFREFGHGEYIYHVCRKTHDWASVVALNRLYFAIAARGNVIMYQPEMEFYSGRCDGFIVAEFGGKKKKFFVEIDRGTAPFKKATVYNALLSSVWADQWWADPLKRGVISFPLVVVLTNRPQVVERDFVKAKFNYINLSLHDASWETIFV